MRSTHTPSRHWDGTPITQRRRRTLTVAHNSPSRLLRTAQPSHCKDCGNRIDWHAAGNHKLIALHPVEAPAEHVPADCQWHLASGIAHPSSDGSPWCRLAHTDVCPADTDPRATPPALDGIRRQLALNTRRMLDTGTFTPAHQLDAHPQSEDSCGPVRPVVQLLYGRYIAASPVEEIRCVAQTVRRTRCTNPILAPGTPPGRWILTQATPSSRRSGRQLVLPPGDFAVYDLGHLPYSEQVRWRTQRCPTHTATTAAPDLARADWEPFDALLHHAFLATRLPEAPPRSR